MCWLSRSDSFHIWNEGSCLLHLSLHQHACHPRHACPRSRLLSWPLMQLFIKHSFPMFCISVALLLISPRVLSIPHCVSFTLQYSVTHSRVVFLFWRENENMLLYLGYKTSLFLWLMYYCTRQESYRTFLLHFCFNFVGKCLVSLENILHNGNIKSFWTAYHVLYPFMSNAALYF